MLKTRRIIIIAVIFLVLVVGVVVVLVVRNKTSPAGSTGPGGLPPISPPTSPTPPPPPIPVPEGDTITIGTPNGSVEVKNPYKNAVRVEAGDYVLFRSTGDYHILYFPADSSFLITILNNPFNEVRSRAESDFLSALGITQPQACLLKVALTVPAFVNESSVWQGLWSKFLPE